MLGPCAHKAWLLLPRTLLCAVCACATTPHLHPQRDGEAIPCNCPAICRHTCVMPSPDALIS